MFLNKTKRKLRRNQRSGLLPWLLTPLFYFPRPEKGKSDVRRWFKTIYVILETEVMFLFKPIPMT